MEDQNPYTAPSTEIDPVVTTVGRPWLASCLLLGVGVCFLLLLNGQSFNNALAFLAFAVVSAALWIRYHFRAKADSPKAGRLALLIHFAIVVAVTASLTNLYSQQQDFNQKLQRIKALHQSQSPGGKSGRPTENVEDVVKLHSLQ